MVLSTPSYIKKAGIADDFIQYDWDDIDSEESYLIIDSRLEHKIDKICDRGVVALSAGFAEWIAWRLRKVSDDHMLFQTIEAVWAGIIDWRYIHFLSRPKTMLSWEDWQGPVRGPLRATFTLLEEILDIVSSDEPASPESVCLSQLVLYILNDPKPFKDWRRFAIRRLAQMYPFRKEDTLGMPIPREVLDPDFDYKPEMAHELLSKYLKSLDHTLNPYLSSPEEMIKSGFEGTPYLL